MVFSAIMYGCESWTIKKADHLRIDAFELWWWRGLLRVPWTARRSNQSILKEINTEYSLEGLMLKLKLQYFGYLMQRTDSLEKTPMLGKTEGERRRGRQDEMVRWHHWLNGHVFEWALGVGDGQGGLACCSPWGLKESDTTERLNWTDKCGLMVFVFLRLISFSEIPSRSIYFSPNGKISLLMTRIPFLMWAASAECRFGCFPILTVYRDRGLLK